MFVISAILLAVPQAERPAVRPVQDAPRPFLYYDYIENGVLRGGTVAIDPTDPLHVDLGVERLVPTSPSTTLVDNGPSANRIDLVFVGDGYTAAELGQYAMDVDAIWPVFLAEPPLATYASYFNVHRVDVTSLESGVDHDPQGVFRNTALDMRYWCSSIQRLLCVNVAKANAEASAAPGRDSVLALANSTTYGGAGYDDLGTLAGRNGAAIEIGLHEFGHSFADLADEYDYGDGSFYAGPELPQPNVTIHTAAELLALSHRWFRWLDLPNVDAFEGAYFNEFGIFRPTFDSKMRSLGRPFQQVNAEALVRHVYRFVSPIDDATLAGTYPLDADFFVDPMDPVGHALNVRWKLDGVVIPGAVSATFDAGSLGLLHGPRELSVEVVDLTPLVRDPEIRALHLTATRSWTLDGGGHVRPHSGTIGTAPPRLALQGAPVRGRTLELWLESDVDAVPIFFLSTGSTGGSGPSIDLRAGLLARRVGASIGPGRPGSVSLAVPENAALLGLPLHAQAALVTRDAVQGSRIVWSNALDVQLER